MRGGRGFHHGSEGGSKRGPQFDEHARGGSDSKRGRFSNSSTPRQSGSAHRGGFSTMDNRSSHQYQYQRAPPVNQYQQQQQRAPPVNQYQQQHQYQRTAPVNQYHHQYQRAVPGNQQYAFGQPLGNNPSQMGPPDIDDEHSPIRVIANMKDCLHSRPPRTEEAFEKLKKLVFMTNFDNLLDNKLAYTLNDMRYLCTTLLQKLSFQDTPNPDLVFTVLQFMSEQQGFSPTEKHHIYYLEALMGRKQINKAIEYLGKMKEQGVSPTYASFRIMVARVLKLNKVHSAMRLLDLMLEKKKEILLAEEEQRKKKEIAKAEEEQRKEREFAKAKEDQRKRMEIAKAEEGNKFANLQHDDDDDDASNPIKQVEEDMEDDEEDKTLEIQEEEEERQESYEERGYMVENDTKDGLPPHPESYETTEEQLDNEVQVEEHPTQMEEQVEGTKGSGKRKSFDHFRIYYELFYSVFDACVRNSMLDKAEKALQLMIEANSFVIRTILYNKLITSYVHKERFEDAQRIFDKISTDGLCKQTTVTFNILLSGYVTQHRMDLALQIFDQMRVHPDITPDAYTMNYLVQGYIRLEQYEKVDEIIQTMSQFKVYPNQSTFAILINSYADRQDMEEAERVLETMEKKQRVTVGVMNTLMKAYVQIGQLDKANEVLKRMKERYRLRPTQDTFTILSSQYEKNQDSKNFGLAMHMSSLIHNKAKEPYSEFLLFQLLSKAPETRAEIKSLFLFKTLQQFKSFRDVKKMKQLLKFMRETIKLKFNEEKANQYLIEAYCSLGLIDKALKLLRKVRDRASPIDKRQEAISKIALLKCYDTIIESYCELDQPEKALELIEQLVTQDSLQPSEYTYIPLIRNYTQRENKLDDAFGIISQMRNRQIPITSVSYNFILLAHANRSDLETCERCFQSMLAGRVLPDVLSYGILFFASSKPKKQGEESAEKISGIEEVQPITQQDELLERMKFGGHGADLITLNNMINSFLLMRHEGISAIDFLVAVTAILKVQPDRATFRILLKFLAEQGRWKEIKQTIAYVKLQNTSLQIHHFTVMMEGYVNHGKIRKAEKLLKRITSKFGLSPTLEIYTALKEYYVTREQWDKAEKLVDQMIEKNIRPSFPTLMSLIHVYMLDKKLDKAEQMIQRMNKHGLKPFSLLWNGLIEQYLNKENFAKIDEVLQSMENFSVQPDPIIFHQLMQYVAINDREKSAELIMGLIEKMIKLDTQPTLETFHILLKFGYLEDGRIDRIKQAERWVRQLQTTTKIFPTIETYNLLLQGYVKCGEWEEAESLVESLSMCRPTVLPNAKTQELLATRNSK